jgi:hypothetical protein
MDGCCDIAAKCAFLQQSIELNRSAGVDAINPMSDAPVNSIFASCTAFGRMKSV